MVVPFHVEAWPSSFEGKEQFPILATADLCAAIKQASRGTTFAVPSLSLKDVRALVEQAYDYEVGLFYLTKEKMWLVSRGDASEAWFPSSLLSNPRLASYKIHTHSGDAIHCILGYLFPSGKDLYYAVPYLTVGELTAEVNIYGVCRYGGRTDAEPYPGEEIVLTRVWTPDHRDSISISWEGWRKSFSGPVVPMRIEHGMYIIEFLPWEALFKKNEQEPDLLRLLGWETPWVS